MANAADSPGVRFATLIKGARSRKGWTQGELAEVSGVARTTIIRWESGKTAQPESEQIRAVCQALDIDPREVVIALGFLTREEVGLPPRPEFEPTETEILEILRDPRVPHELKLEWRDYLVWQHQRKARGARGRGA